MKQRSGTSFDKATILTRSKICVVVLITTVLVETVFVVCSGVGYVDTSPRSGASNSTSNSTSRPIITTRRPPTREEDARMFLQVYEYKCKSAMALRDGQRPKVNELTVGSATDRKSYPSICSCTPKTLGRFLILAAVYTYYIATLWILLLSNPLYYITLIIFLFNEN